MNKITMMLTIVPLLIVLSLSVWASCPPDCPESLPDSSTFNPDDPSSFDYDSGDYSTITDWTKVDWSQIPPRRIPEVPSTSLNYAQLNVGQRGEMSIDQIQYNLGNIENLATDVNEERAKMAIHQMTGVTIESFGNGASVQQGILKSEQGQFVFAGREGWKVKVDTNGRIYVVSTSEINEDDIHTKDHFTAQAAFLTTSDGTRRPIGGLSFREGSAYVEKGDILILSDEYAIPADLNQVYIFFKRQSVKFGNYVEIGENKLEAGSSPGGMVMVIPRPGNELFAMLRKDYDNGGYAPSENDEIILSVAEGDRVSIESRKKEGKIPRIQHYDGGGNTQIETGRLDIKIAGGNLHIIPPETLPLTGKLPPPRNSVAFELESNSPQAPGTLLRTSSSNRYVLLSNGKEVAGSDLGLTVSDRADVNMLKTIEDLKNSYPDIYFRVSGREEEEDLTTGQIADTKRREYLAIEEISAQMAQTVNQWLQMYPEKASKINTIIFTGDANAGALSESSAGTVILGERIFDPATHRIIELDEPERFLNPLMILTHEAEHVQDSQVENAEKQLKRFLESGESEERRQQKSLGAQYNQLAAKMYRELLADQTYQDLTEEWVQLSGVHIEPEADLVEKGRLSTLQESVLRFRKSPNPHELMETLHQWVAFSREDPEAMQVALQLRFLLKEKLGGFPPYAFRDYGQPATPQFREVSSTYTEIPREQVHREIAKGNPVVRDATQLAYDSGKMNEQEYRYRMGNYCQQKQCGKCLLYTLTCKP